MESIVLIALLLPGLIFLFVIVAAVLLHPREMYKEHRNGICNRCGYNLTGNVSGKCPECGLRISQRRAAM